MSTRTAERKRLEKKLVDVEELHSSLKATPAVRGRSVTPAPASTPVVASGGGILSVLRNATAFLSNIFTPRSAIAQPPATGFKTGPKTAGPVLSIPSPLPQPVLSPAEAVKKRGRSRDGGASPDGTAPPSTTRKVRIVEAGEELVPVPVSTPGTGAKPPSALKGGRAASATPRLPGVHAPANTPVTAARTPRTLKSASPASAKKRSASKAPPSSAKAKATPASPPAKSPSLVVPNSAPKSAARGKSATPAAAAAAAVASPKAKTPGSAAKTAGKTPASAAKQTPASAAKSPRGRGRPPGSGAKSKSATPEAQPKKTPRTSIKSARRTAAKAVADPSEFSARRSAAYSARRGLSAAE